ncbi:unnamed protein product [Prorocentrum cordatum]|uniref:Uncharacterized protein n=1 Tax=Prorocentrum cordatum TaxID=2364126 RepID=A0ABN9P8H9_9DINO|nr:unnamed protein product [Polarella glacialis]|mmetsp:Transcript_75682/g.200778  ORF Transcript_75682/g.200778 Transcript_75682/m.200778 type:complete len:195 (+) Transcript_75682:88-672(+)
MMRVLTAAAALQLGSALVKFHAKEDHLLGNRPGASSQNNQEERFPEQVFMTDSKPAAQDETAVAIEAEMLEAMADAKAQLEVPITANAEVINKGEDGVHARLAQGGKELKKIEGTTAIQDEIAAEIEAEMLQAMADAQAWPEVSITGDKVHANLAQRFNERKKIVGKPAAQDEAAEIEKEILQAMADARLGPRA